MTEDNDIEPLKTGDSVIVEQIGNRWATFVTLDGPPEEAGDNSQKEEPNGRSKRSQSKASARIGNISVPFCEIVGNPYASTLRLGDAGQWKRVKRSCLDRFSGDGTDDYGAPTEDNRFLIDDNSAQQLSQDEIQRIKEEGGGTAVIDALVKGSSTFSKKTAFSQEKYLAKKQKKHISEVKLVRPDSYSMCEMYWNKDPAKIGGLRPDYLTSLLSYGNVQPESNVFVIDHSLGAAIAAATERVDSGTVFWLRDKGCSDSILRLLNLHKKERCSQSNDAQPPQESTTCVVTGVSSNDLTCEENVASSNPRERMKDPQTSAQKPPDSAAGHSGSEEIKTDSKDNENTNASQNRHHEGFQKKLKSLEQLETQGVDTMIVVLSYLKARLQFENSPNPMLCAVKKIRRIAEQYLNPGRQFIHRKTKQGPPSFCRWKIRPPVHAHTACC
eukprot:Selendium_serpulae@DN6070_c0_g1_i1.p1